MIALIDGDILLYRIGHTTVNDPEDIARIRVDDLLDSILLETKATEFEVWLSDNRDNNFRYQVWSEYKANRTAPRPLHYEAIKEHLVKEWGARFAYGMEADDALGIGQDWASPEEMAHCGIQHNSVICSIDKDLLQIPGLHYNFVRKEWQTVTEWEGIQWFYKQILIGDTSDNVQGCSGIGPVKAGKAIDPIRAEAGEAALYQTTREIYQRQEKGWSSEEIVEHIRLVGRLLKIKQQEDEPLWDIPSAAVTMVTPMSLSTPLLPGAPTPFTEPTLPERSTVGSLVHGDKTASTLKEKPLVLTLQGR